MPKPLSAYLPEAFDPRLPIALIAGKGIYPALVARAARASGIPVRLIAFDGETDPDLVASFPETERHCVHVGQVGKTLRLLDKLGAGYAIMAGQVTPRRLFHGLRPDLKAAQILLTLKRRNAETIFGAVAKEIEALGIRLLDARAFLDGQLVSLGCMTGDRFPIEKEYLDHGIHVAKECARLDIGQGCVVRKGAVLAGRDALREDGQGPPGLPLRRALLRDSNPGDDARVGAARRGPRGKGSPTSRQRGRPREGAVLEDQSPRLLGSVFKARA